MANYNAKVLPENWKWVGAIANADGFNGHAHVANIARDTENILWCFTQRGRYRIGERTFADLKISDKPLQEAPFRFNPIS